MKIDLNKPLLDLDGKGAGQGTIGKLFATVLASVSEGDPLKYMGWAISLNKGEAIEVDTADAEHLRSFVTSSRSMANIVKNAILQEIIKARDAKA